MQVREPQCRKVAAMSASPISRYGSGKSVKRVEDEALGRGHHPEAANKK